MTSPTINSKVAKLISVPLLAIIGILAVPNAASAAITHTSSIDTPNVKAQVCDYRGYDHGMLVGSAPYVSDRQNTLAFVRYEHVGSSGFSLQTSNWFAFQTNRSNPPLAVHIPSYGGWVDASWAGQGLGLWVPGDPTGDRIVQHTYIMRGNGNFDHRAETVLSC